MKNVIKLFANNLTLHRSPIIDDDGNVIGLISQSRIIEWFSHEITKFPEIKDRKISEWLNKCDKSPISVDNQMKTLDAYRLMLEKVIFYYFLFLFYFFFIFFLFFILLIFFYFYYSIS